jgi:hypothetical protein
MSPDWLTIAAVAFVLLMVAVLVGGAIWGAVTNRRSQKSAGDVWQSEDARQTDQVLANEIERQDDTGDS